MTATGEFDPARDLLLERVVPVPRAFVWAAWTQPDLVVQWFTPAPYTTVDCEIATAAIRNECMLLTADKDFSRMAQHCDLKLL